MPLSKLAPFSYCQIVEMKPSSPFVYIHFFFNLFKRCWKKIQSKGCYLKRITTRVTAQLILNGIFHKLDRKYHGNIINGISCHYICTCACARANTCLGILLFIFIHKLPNIYYILRHGRSHNSSLCRNQTGFHGFYLSWLSPDIMDVCLSDVLFSLRSPWSYGNSAQQKSTDVAW